MLLTVCVGVVVFIILFALLFAVVFFLGGGRGLMVGWFFKICMCVCVSFYLSLCKCYFTLHLCSQIVQTESSLLSYLIKFTKLV